MTINKWAKPILKLELPPRVHLQKESKIKQIWELWSVNVALAMSTWNDVAVTYWHQVYHQSEESYRDWRRSSMTERFAYEKRYLYGRKAPVPATCDSVEALLRHELLAHLPEWLSCKAGVLGCTSSPTILFMCWKEIFPNEDATRFDLVDALYALPAKMPTSMYQFASWLEDWMTKLVVADEVSARCSAPSCTSGRPCSVLWSGLCIGPAEASTSMPNMSVWTSCRLAAVILILAPRTAAAQCSMVRSMRS